jgi:hypothetical protein
MLQEVQKLAAENATKQGFLSGFEVLKQTIKSLPEMLTKAFGG